MGSFFNFCQMRKLLITIEYKDNTNKFWADSIYRRVKVPFDDSVDTVHKIIEKLCLEENMVLMYKAVPRSTIYTDDGNGIAKAIGYIYRGKTTIDAKQVYFDVWTTIDEIIDFPIVELDA